MAVYSKICIICSHEFFTVRVNSLYCSKKCRNRVRYLPQPIINSLIKRNAQFTMKANKFTASIDNKTINSAPITNEEIAYATALARDEARKRGINLTKVEDANIDFINKTDPANGGSDGFGVSSEIQELPVKQVVEELPVVQLSTEARLSKGLKRLGGK